MAAAAKLLRHAGDVQRRAGAQAHRAPAVGLLARECQRLAAGDGTQQIVQLVVAGRRTVKLLPVAERLPGKQHPAAGMLLGALQQDAEQPALGEAAPPVDALVGGARVAAAGHQPGRGRERRGIAGRHVAEEAGIGAQPEQQQLDLGGTQLGAGGLHDELHQVGGGRRRGIDQPHLAVTRTGRPGDVVIDHHRRQAGKLPGEAAGALRRGAVQQHRGGVPAQHLRFDPGAEARAEAANLVPLERPRGVHPDPLAEAAEELGQHELGGDAVAVRFFMPHQHQRVGGAQRGQHVRYGSRRSRRRSRHGSNTARCGAPPETTSALPCT